MVSVGRSDYGIYRPVLRALSALGLHSRLFVAGTHLSEAHGLTVREIERDGHEIAARVETVGPRDAPLDIALAMGRATAGLAHAYERERPDILLLLGDRYEMHAAGVAALPFGLPVAHLHGGESTEGLIDEGLRHSLTKLSHLHFVSHEQYARRVMRMGEEPWRVVVSGAPALDDALSAERPSPGDLGRRLGLPVEDAVLVTYHPVTLEHDRVQRNVLTLIEALARVDRPLLFTFPNADTSGRAVIKAIREFVEVTPRARAVESLGATDYFGLLASVAVMVGNSSSGIIEAPSFALPFVNIGRRQAGRLRATNVIDVADDVDAIVAGIARALEPSFRVRLRGAVNPFGDGKAGRRIAERLASVPLDDRLLQKRFHDV